MELRRTDWGVLLDDEKHGGLARADICVWRTKTTPILECVPTSGAISAEEREKLIVGAAAARDWDLRLLRSAAIG